MTESPPPLRIGDGPMLLLDDHLVADAHGCRQTFHAAVKDPANPILVKTEPWEGHGPYVWGNSVIWNPDLQQYDIYYNAFRHEDNYYRWGLAVSKDGLHWTKPDLFIAPFESSNVAEDQRFMDPGNREIEALKGKLMRNMLPPGSTPHKPSLMVVRDPRPDCPPAERYRGIRFSYQGEFVAHSADGRYWTEYPDNPVWHVPSDAIQPMWDPHRQRFTAYFKIWEVTGETPEGPVRWHMPNFDHKPQGDGWTKLWGSRVIFQPDSAAKVEEATVVLRAANQGVDDGGGAPLTGAWHARRVTAWAESDDWRHWRGERVVLAVDERDRPDANIQNFNVIHHGGYYIGFLTMHDERGHFETQLAFSRDGLGWSRPWRGNFIGLGPAGAFDSGMVLGASEPILTDTQMLFHYGGWDILHWQPSNRPWTSVLARAILRRDGFASWDADGLGTVTTQPLFAAEGDLCVNADASDGRLTVEVLDERGRVVQGFAAAHCEPIGMDTTQCENCMTPVRWKDRADLHPLGGRPVRLRFHLERARLFSFRCGT